MPGSEPLDEQLSTAQLLTITSDLNLKQTWYTSDTVIKVGIHIRHLQYRGRMRLLNLPPLAYRRKKERICLSHTAWEEVMRTAGNNWNQFCLFVFTCKKIILNVLFIFTAVVFFILLCSWNACMHRYEVGSSRSCANAPVALTILFTRPLGSATYGELLAPTGHI